MSPLSASSLTARRSKLFKLYRSAKQGDRVAQEEYLATLHKASPGVRLLALSATLSHLRSNSGPVRAIRWRRRRRFRCAKATSLTWRRWSATSRRAWRASRRRSRRCCSSRADRCRARRAAPLSLAHTAAAVEPHLLSPGLAQERVRAAQAPAGQAAAERARGGARVPRDEGPARRVPRSGDALSVRGPGRHRTGVLCVIVSCSHSRPALTLAARQI